MGCDAKLNSVTIVIVFSLYMLEAVISLHKAFRVVIPFEGVVNLFFYFIFFFNS